MSESEQVPLVATVPASEIAAQARDGSTADASAATGMRVASASACRFDQTRAQPM